MDCRSEQTFYVLIRNGIEGLEELKQNNVKPTYNNISSYKPPDISIPSSMYWNKIDFFTTFWSLEKRVKKYFDQYFYVACFFKSGYKPPRLPPTNKST